MRELGAACVWLGFAVMLDDIGARPVARWLLDELEALDRPPWLPVLGCAATRYAQIDEDDQDKEPMDTDLWGSED